MVEHMSSCGCVVVTKDRAVAKNLEFVEPASRLRNQKRAG